MLSHLSTVIVYFFPAWVRDKYSSRVLPASVSNCRGLGECMDLLPDGYSVSYLHPSLYLASTASRKIQTATARSDQASTALIHIHINERCIHAAHSTTTQDGTPSVPPPPPADGR